MSNVIDFSKYTNDADSKLIKGIAESEELKDCLEKFIKLNGFKKLNKNKIAIGFYIYGFLDALKLEDKI